MNRMLLYALLATVALLAPLALPLYALDMTERLPALVAEAERAAVAELAGDAAYRTAGEAQKKLLRNAALRRQVVAKTMAELDEMQRKVDREFDVRLAKAFDRDGGLMIAEGIKKEVMSRFKAEMFLYMAGDRSADVTIGYGNAEGGSGNIGYYIELHFKNNIGFRNDMEKILNKISADLKDEFGYKVSREWVLTIVSYIEDVFNW